MTISQEIANTLVRVSVTNFPNNQTYVEVVLPNWKSAGEGYYGSTDTLDKESIAEKTRELMKRNIQNESVKWREGQMLCNKLIMMLRKTLSPIELRDSEVQELLQEVEKW